MKHNMFDYRQYKDKPYETFFIKGCRVNKLHEARMCKDMKRQQDLLAEVRLIEIRIEALNKCK